MAFSKPTEVHRLPAPKSGEVLHFDDGKGGAAGLALRLRAGGSRKWVFFYRLGGRQLKYTIGDATAWSLDNARVKARSLRVKVDNGENPVAEKVQRVQTDKLTLEGIIDDYLTVKARTMKERSLEETTRHLKKLWAPLHRLPAAGITRAMVASQLRAIADERGPVSADRARSSLSALYAWAIGEGLCDANPVVGTNKHSEDKPRERLLTDAELAKIWLAAPKNDYGRIVKLLMLTAQRREEIGGLRHAEVKRDMKATDKGESKLIELPGERTKNGRPHLVPLSDLAIEVLQSQPRRMGRDLVFGEGEGGYSGWSRSKEVLDEACGVKDWTLHDLRRTAATRMADLGVQPHIIEAILNHVSGHKSGVAGIYNLATYATEKRAALDLWANHLRVAIAKAEGANVVKLTKTRA